MLIFIKAFGRFYLGRMAPLCIQIAGKAFSFSLGSPMTAWKLYSQVLIYIYLSICIFFRGRIGNINLVLVDQLCPIS